MDEWLKREIDAARERKERRERKLARREMDAQVIASGKEKFWEALHAALRAAVDDFNAAGVSDAPVTVDVKDGYLIYVRTPGYPSHQLLLEYRAGMNDIAMSLGRYESTVTPLAGLLKGTLDFDVTDDGHLVVRDNGSMMDVSQTVEYLLRRVLPVINSGR